MLLVNIGCKISFLPGTKWEKKTGWQAESGRVRPWHVHLLPRWKYLLHHHRLCSRDWGWTCPSACTMSLSRLVLEQGEGWTRGNPVGTTQWWERQLILLNFPQFEKPCNLSIADSDCIYIYIPRMVRTHFHCLVLYDFACHTVYHATVQWASFLKLSGALAVGFVSTEDDPKVIHVPETVPKNWPLIHISSLKVT